MCLLDSKVATRDEEEESAKNRPLIYYFEIFGINVIRNIFVHDRSLLQTFYV